MQQSLRCNRFTSTSELSDEVTYCQSWYDYFVTQLDVVLAHLSLRRAAMRFLCNTRLFSELMNCTKLVFYQIDGLAQKTALFYVVALGTISTIDNQSLQFCKVYT
ncbi:Hypothetical_protein [Hexamita inflata]|uniref:Hypothetical_protein n=1 Tax=Hexamita inflata TaxID=28002 RepID=A0ABP1KTJ5_9EUKA